MNENKKIVKIYWVPCYRDNRENLLIKQGLTNNPRVELVASADESDFVFQFHYPAKHNEFYRETTPAHKTVFIDYHDNPNWFSSIDCVAYFKRSWAISVKKDGYTVRKHREHPANCYPLTMAIMDEFIIRENLERDILLSCTLRNKRRKGHFDRVRILELLKSMNLKGNVLIHALNGGNMKRFNASDMKDYFRHLKKSRIVVTCNPSRWEGDHRTWEALANGALVFVDRTLTPLVHPLVDGKHCLFYDLSDKGLKILEGQIEYALKNTSFAEHIAQAGHEFAMKHHRASNRIDEILARIL